MIAEELLHFVWQLRLFNQLALFSQAGEPIRIIHPGHHNNDAGPDFLHAIIQIGAYEWHGHIEIHVDGRDWNKHKHQFDAAYNNVILHVLMSNPIVVLREDASPIPTLLLKDHLNMGLISTYELMMREKAWVPCAKLAPTVNNLFKVQALERALFERLEAKATLVIKLLQETQGNWERTVFMMLCRAFGMKVNAETFLDFAKQLDFELLRRLHSDERKLTALFFGQSGMLDGEPMDAYMMELQSEYAYLKKLYRLKPSLGLQWKYLRMRPYNFPSFRMAQLVALYGQFPYLFQKLIDADALQPLLQTFSEIQSYSYWNEHFSFGKKSSRVHQTKLTPSFVKHLAINVFVPLLYAYGKFIADIDMQQRAIDWLVELPVEQNNITKSYLELEMPLLTAADSQAVLQLHKHHCQPKRCLSCAIGSALLKG